MAFLSVLISQAFVGLDPWNVVVIAPSHFYLASDPNIYTVGKMLWLPLLGQGCLNRRSLQNWKYACVIQKMEPEATSTDYM